MHSPFFNERQTDIDVLMFHCSAQPTQEMIETLNQAELSCHYIIDIDGTITNLVDETKRAWHAGIGSWRDIKEDMNSHSIGIELCSPSLGQAPYPQQQIEALKHLCHEIINRWHIKPQNIIGHSDYAPTRKPDPGKAFPWAYLASDNIGLWYNLADSAQAPTDNIKTLLSGIGYDTISDNSFKASQYAFARHFIPNMVESTDNIPYLLDNVYPQDIDFSHNDQFIATAQAVYMRFNA